MYILKLNTQINYLCAGRLVIEPKYQTRLVFTKSLFLSNMFPLPAFHSSRVVLRLTKNSNRELNRLNQNTAEILVFSDLRRGSFFIWQKLISHYAQPTQIILFEFFLMDSILTVFNIIVFTWDPINDMI